MLGVASICSDLLGLCQIIDRSARSILSSLDNWEINYFRRMRLVLYPWINSGRGGPVQDEGCAQSVKYDAYESVTRPPLPLPASTPPKEIGVSAHFLDDVEYFGSDGIRAFKIIVCSSVRVHVYCTVHLRQ
jgi:hypothetical protein